MVGEEARVLAMGQTMHDLVCLLFSHSFCKYLLNNYYVPGPGVGTGIHSAVNKRGQKTPTQPLFIWNLHSSGKKQAINNSKNISVYIKCIGDK